MFYLIFKNNLLKNNWNTRITIKYYHTKHILPKTSQRIIQPKQIQKEQIEFKQPPIIKQTINNVNYEFRKNQLNIQMLSKTLFKQIFKNTKLNECNPELLEKCIKELNKHNININDNNYLDDVNFEIPKLLGNNIVEHFNIIANEQIIPYKNIVDSLLTNLPKPPKKWLMKSGWLRYSDDNIEPEIVPYPLEDGLVFDVEVCMKAGKLPTLATAVSNKAWYSWISDSLINCNIKPAINNNNLPHYSINDNLIPIESTDNDDGLKLNDFMKKPKIIVGHNVAFDRTRIKEQYWLKRTGTRFIDTMSLHICISGLTSYQRSLLNKSNKKSSDEDSIDDSNIKLINENDEDDIWKKFSSLNSLSEIYKLYYNEILKKDTRDLFVNGQLNDIQLNFEQAMFYCCNDVIATYKILQKLFPLFNERFPNPVTLAGMLELSTSYLPINNNWIRYINETEQIFNDLEIENRLLLTKHANQTCQLLHNEKYKEDLWMWDEDWDIKEIKLKKTKIKAKKIETINTESIENQTKKRKNKKINEPKLEIDNKIRTAEDDIDEIDLYYKNKFESLWKTNEYLPKVKTLLPGYPNWYRKLCVKFDEIENKNTWIPGPQSVSTSMKITPKLLSLTWEGYPLYYIRDKGWGFLIPFKNSSNTKLPIKQLLDKYPLKCLNKNKNDNSDDILMKISELVEKNLIKKDYFNKKSKKQENIDENMNKIKEFYNGTGIWCDTIIDDCCWLLKLPHKNGLNNNVGNPLGRDFLIKFSDNILAGNTENAEYVLTISRMLSYWRNNRERIKDQMVIWFNKNNLPKYLRDDNNLYGAILPQVIVCGTLTRRAVEPTWMTATNVNKDRIGSELRSMIQTPPGYYFVGADVDSQELWIASTIGDANYGQLHGCTPLGWMTLSGNKSNATDMHSITAKAIGITRNEAKIINYARIYGAGQNFAERLLKQFNPLLTDNEAKSKASKMFLLTKGRKIYYLKNEFLDEHNNLINKQYTKWQANELSKLYGKKIDEMFSKSIWLGGTESAMFNQLELIANSNEPKTPFLNGRLTRALELQTDQKTINDKYLPTRINWVVQSGAVDFLHLMLVCMRWLLNDNIRFCLSFHDEVRYLVPEKFKYQTALAMHLTNLLTRSFCSYQLGIYDLPQSVAFFSSVEIDTVLRKDAKLDCKTPTNPYGLEKGYNIPNGESLNIYEAIKKATSINKCWYDNKL